MASSSETAISNLVYRYAEFMDHGDFAGAAGLFAHARVLLDRASGFSVDAAGIEKIWTDGVMRYNDGTPRTKHVTTNLIIEVDEEAGLATCRSYYTVFQQTDAISLQPIIAGRYHDRFERVDDVWRFTERDYSLVDLLGDLSQHLRGELPARPSGPPD